MRKPGSQLRVVGVEWSRRDRLQVFLVAAVLLHLLLGLFVVEIAPTYVPPPKRTPMRFVMVEVPEKPEDAKVPDTVADAVLPVPDLDGQIVELAPPDEEKRPEQADYLSSYDITVDQETRTDRFAVNPEILSPQFAEEQKMKQAEAQDLGMTKPSTGAQIGNNRKPLGDRGSMAALPSPWSMTNKEGFEDPTLGSGASSDLAGAPQNDLLDEALGDRVSLNSRESPWADYMNRIRRSVNFFWTQCLDNLPPGTTLAKATSTTSVDVVLDGQGALEVVQVVRRSGSPELDECVVRAFRMGSPFPNPPAGLVARDGRVYLPGMSFTVSAGQARMNYGGVDPRSGVQFPGLMKSPY